MRVLAALAIVAAVGMAGAALALSIIQRTKENGEHDKGASRPVLTLWRYRQGPFASDATRVPPGKFDSTNASCPSGYAIVSGGVEVTGPGIVTRSTPAAKDVWLSEVYNATTALSTGNEAVAIGGAGVCMKAEDIRIRTVEGAVVPRAARWLAS